MNFDKLNICQVTLSGNIEIIKKNNFDRVKLFNNLKNKGQSFSIVKGIKNSITSITK